jgi:hypothetical protein
VKAGKRRSDLRRPGRRGGGDQPCCRTASGAGTGFSGFLTRSARRSSSQKPEKLTYARPNAPTSGDAQCSRQQLINTLPRGHSGQVTCILPDRKHNARMALRFLDAGPPGHLYQTSEDPLRPPRPKSVESLVAGVVSAGASPSPPTATRQTLVTWWYGGPTIRPRGQPQGHRHRPVGQGPVRGRERRRVCRDCRPEGLRMGGLDGPPAPLLPPPSPGGAQRSREANLRQLGLSADAVRKVLETDNHDEPQANPPQMVRSRRSSSTPNWEMASPTSVWTGS